MGSGCASIFLISDKSNIKVANNKQLKGEEDEENNEGGQHTRRKDKKRAKIDQKNLILLEPINEEKDTNDTDNNNNKKKTQEDEETKVLKVIKKHNTNFDDKDLIINCLENEPYLSTLHENSLLEIVKEMSLCSVEMGNTIFKQGNIGRFFYIIKEGEIDLIINNQVKKTLSTGECFGEFALLHLAPRSGTTIAKTNCLLYFLRRKNFRKIIEFIAQSHYEKCRKFVEKTDFFSFFTSSEKYFFYPLMFKVKFEKGSKIFTQDEQANCIYVIDKGNVNLYYGKKLLYNIKEKDYFGDGSLLNKGKNCCNVFANTDCDIYTISLSTFKEMYGINFHKQLILNAIKVAFIHSKIFSQIDTRVLEGDVFDLFEFYSLNQGQVAYKEGTDISQTLVIIIVGNLAYNNEREILFSKNQIIFEENVFYNKKLILKKDLVANPFCLLAAVDVNKLLKFLDNSFEGLSKIREIIENLRKIKLFETLSVLKICQISRSIKEEKFSKDDYIIKQGAEGNKFYIIKSGTVEIYKDNKYMRTITKNNFLGERSLLIKERRSATAICITDTIVYSLSKEDFLKIIEKNMEKYLINRLSLQDDQVELSDLIFENTLGKGNYGTVCMVKNSKNNFQYAIKSISKKQIVYNNMESNLELEKDILLQVDHPFIVKLVKTLNDSKYVYFLMEYVKGKDLFDVIRDIGLLNKYQTQFYSCSLFVIINYLHSHKFIYRDIKPENIVVEENGYIKLIDFGAAKKIEDKTKTVIGTPYYMAPEVFSGEGYSFEADYWSVAICMYEFMCGYVPFGEDLEDPLQIYNTIMKSDLDFPSIIKDKCFKELMRGMLNKNLMVRICNFEQIKIHPWFKTFDWEGLLNMALKPARIPDIIFKSNSVKIDGMKYVDYIKNFVKDWNDTKVEEPINLDTNKDIFNDF